MKVKGVINIDERQLAELTERLDTITKLLALNLPEDMTTAEKIVKLRNVGLKAGQIAAVIGTSEGYVSVALDRSKRAKNRAKKPGTKKA